MKINNIQPIAFKSTYTVDTGSVTTRDQLFTLGAMMNNFWINSPRATFMNIKNNGVYGFIDIDVKNNKDKLFERVMTNNGILFEKNSNINYLG